MVSSGKAKREPRSNRVGRELALLRRRNAEQLAQARERERRVDDALRDYAAAATRIASAEQAHDAKARRLRERIDALAASHAEAVEQDVAAQALAVRQIYDSGRTVRDLAELLDLSQRAVGRLLETSRDVEQSGDASAAAAKWSMSAADPSPAEHIPVMTTDRGSADSGTPRDAAPGTANEPGGEQDVGNAGDDAAPGWSLDGPGEDRV